MYFLMLCAVFILAYQIIGILECLCTDKPGYQKNKAYIRMLIFSTCVTFLFYNAW